MDKYTYNVKAEKIQKLVKKGEYAAAVKIAETVDWEEVHSVRLLTITAAAYERIRDYKGAIELLQMAYDESAVGKRILYKLTGLAIADRDVELAQNYYEMYLQEAPEENGRYLLRYLLAELKGESLDKRIAILETYRKYEFEEEWALRLAELYDEAGVGDACVKLCDEIILWFGVGEYVDAALKLKSKYAPLSAEQQDKLDNRDFYEQRYQEVAAEYREKDEAPEEPEEETDGEENAGEKEPAADEEQAETPAESPLLPEPKSDAWRGRILFVGADSLEKAMPEVLGLLKNYHEKMETPMAVTRIPAVKFNKLGMEASRPHIAGKDLIVDGAAALTDELLQEIVAYVKEEGTTTVFALTDTATELAYLDNRLGALIKEDELPDIDTGAAETPELQLDLEAVMDDEPAVDLGGTTKEIVTQVKAALGETDEPVLDERAAVSDTVKFDKGVVAEEAAAEAEAAPAATETAAEAVAASAAAILPKAAETLPETSETLTEAVRETILPENDDDYRQETIEDFFRARDEAAEKVEEVKAEAETAQQQMEAVIVAVEGKTDEHGEALAEKAEEITAAAAETEELKADAEEKAKGPSELFEEARKAVEEKTEAVREAEAKTEEVTASAEETDVFETVSEELKTAAAEAAAETGEAEEELVSEAFAEPEDPQEALRKKARAIPGSMTPESFIIYAKNYLTSIDCVLEEDGEAALMNAAEYRVSEGTALTKEEAENIIEAAADLSEKKGGLFTRRYNKEGCLILKTKFIV